MRESVDVIRLYVFIYGTIFTFSWLSCLWTRLLPVKFLYNCLALKHLSCLSNFCSPLWKSITSTKAKTLHCCLHNSQWHQFSKSLESESQWIHRSTKPNCNVRTRCFFTFSLLSVSWPPSLLIDVSGKSFRNQWSLAQWKLKVPSLSFKLLYLRN